MGWAIGYDRRWLRDIGYGVPALCDHPGCTEQIDRGLYYVCGGEPKGGDDGCGLYFCSQHLFLMRGFPQRCERCCEGERPFQPKPDVPRWLHHKLTDETWQTWRDENPYEVIRLQRSQAVAKDSDGTERGC
jgi:hypothetical protein